MKGIGIKTMEKMTKRNFYEALVNFATTGVMTYEAKDSVVTVDADAIKAFAENEIKLLDKKALKAKETAAKKRTEADALTLAVRDALTDEYEVIADIAARVEGEEVTVSKVTYRLNKLVEMGLADKTDLKIAASEGKKARTVKGYKIVERSTQDADEE